MEQAPTYGPEFFFGNNAVGLFIGADAPRSPGRHRYEPYRGPGHYDMQSARRNGDQPRCYYDANGIRITFKVSDCPEYGVLDLQEFEETQLERLPAEAGRFGNVS